MARLYLQFRMFDSPGEVPCDSLEEAAGFYRDYAGDLRRREREGVLAVWVTHGGRTVLGEPPASWVPGRVNAIIAARLPPSPFA
jgi:hypothetical protein